MSIFLTILNSQFTIYKGFLDFGLYLQDTYFLSTLPLSHQNALLIVNS